LPGNKNPGEFCCEGDVVLCSTRDVSSVLLGASRSCCLSNQVHLSLHISTCTQQLGQMMVSKKYREEVLS
jgi:hypothetical protein